MKLGPDSMNQFDEPSGARVEWVLDPITLEPREAAIFPPGRPGPIAVRYRRYRAAPAGGTVAFIPGEVVVEDAAEGFRMRAFLRDLEVNPSLEPDAFEIEMPAPAGKETP